eukprot:1161558-Pelagomonas_calceolata.AAC.4
MAYAASLWLVGCWRSKAAALRPLWGGLCWTKHAHHLQGLQPLQGMSYTVGCSSRAWLIAGSEAENHKNHTCKQAC